MTDAKGTDAKGTNATGANVKGVGIDVVNIERIETMLAKHPERMKGKVFTQAEFAYAEAKSNGNAQQLASSLAARWAAKEAVAKALGTGFGEGLYWQNIEVISDGGPPQVVLRDVSAELASKRFLLSISHDYPTATAIAMLVE